MNIKKVLEFSQDEIELLMNAGKFLASVNEGMLAKNFDEYSDEAKRLIRALYDVIHRDGILTAVETGINE